MTSDFTISKASYRKQGNFKSAIGPTLPKNQVWVDMQVRICKEDTNEAMLFPYQAYLHPIALHRQWKRFNYVLGLQYTSMPTMYAKALVIGAIVAIGLFVLFIFYGLEDVPRDQRFLSIILIFIVCLLFGFGISWLIWSRWAYNQCYIRTYVAENLDYSNPGDCINISRLYLPRMVFLNRPDVFRGNDGANGVLDKNAIIRLQSNFGQTITEITNVETYYDLPGDEYGMRDAEASDIYNLYHLAGTGGKMCSTFNDPEKNKMNGFFTTNWPWFIIGGMLLLAFYLAFATFN